MEDVTRFLKYWTEDGLGTKPIFLSLVDEVSGKPDVGIEFIARPGISYSLRGNHPNRSERSLFVMIDVIDDDPSQRWLSVCFYGDMIHDPEQLGDLIPEGLLGSDGYCFDITECDDHITDYIAGRIREAYRNACSDNQRRSTGW